MLVELRREYNKREAFGIISNCDNQVDQTIQTKIVWIFDDRVTTVTRKW